MKPVREWMQMEVWSPRTTKKIFRVSMKIVIALGVVLVIFASWEWVSYRYMTPHEKKLVRKILSEVDSVHPEQLSEAEFSQAESIWKGEIEQAREAAWTGADEIAVNLVDVYSMEQRDVWHGLHYHPRHTSNSERDRKIDELRIQNHEMLKQLLEVMIGDRSKVEERLWQRTLAK